MIQRLIQALLALLNGYSFYRNPAQYIISVIVMALIPVLFYVVGGVIAFAILIGIAAYFLVRYIYTQIKKQSA